MRESEMNKTKILRQRKNKMISKNIRKWLKGNTAGINKGKGWKYKLLFSYYDILHLEREVLQNSEEK